MKHALTGLLLAASSCAFLLATPAVAQVAGNPGDLHTPTVYTSEVRSQAYGVATPGFGGPLGPLGVIAAPVSCCRDDVGQRRQRRRLWWCLKTSMVG